MGTACIEAPQALVEEARSSLASDTSAPWARTRPAGEGLVDLEYAAEPGDADADADDAEEQPAVVAALVVPAGAGDAVAGGLVGAVDLVEAGAAGLEESPVEVEPAEEPEAAQVVTEAIRVMAIRPAARTADDVEAPGAEEVAGGGQAGSSLFVWRVAQVGSVSGARMRQSGRHGWWWRRSVISRRPFVLRRYWHCQTRTQSQLSCLGMG